MSYYIRYEQMGHGWYYMIYQRVLCLHRFYERWDTPETATARLSQLNA